MHSIYARLFNLTKNNFFEFHRIGDKFVRAFQYKYEFEKVELVCKLHYDILLLQVRKLDLNIVVSCSRGNFKFEIANMNCTR